ncbi:hypothetical protein HDR66_02495 [bacterium]|nr:hypothetical protein [bacterium]
MSFGTAIQSGNQIIVTDAGGNVSRVFDGRLISYTGGVLTYYPTNASKTSMYVGL